MADKEQTPAERLKEYTDMIYDESYKAGESEALLKALEELPVSPIKGFALPRRIDRPQQPEAKPGEER